ncbi:sugar phosphate isomerase/epimerase [Alicyclobacillus fastidiosus]|uniref:Sugar phosphate isomerase/epimerase n=1 Tax=Alicyclobacillus fastidiosus TaxID=392011 RepID=A0ABY6ZCL8_9BACL|nr:sugar phosphate isomerase/epimerase family protein [Alicyclobacillus fastidiosus]WAH39860.1 sugar phosphate isomerase/epimerase [Alicyclobacillus fastidiosus]GMA61125.1 hypothetical protein GCM10025859_15650 [Alicyclobacillus fastidiosus]
MKIAFSNLACPEWSMEQVIQNAVEFGYDGVELRLVDGEVIRSDMDSAAQKRIVALAKDNGIEIIGIGASTRFATPDAEERDRNVTELLAYIELAAKMEIPMVRTFGGGVRGTSEMKQGDDIQFVAESLNKVASRGAELGIQVLLETHDEFSSSHLVRAVLQSVPSKAIGALWDTHHPYRMNETVDETYENRVGSGTFI